MSEQGIPRWVEDEIWNWARAQWDGPGVGPKDGRIASAEGMYVAPPYTGPAEDEDDVESVRIPVCHDRAARVGRVYGALPLIEQRVVQVEYTRRHEYPDLPAHLRRAAACRQLGLGQTYYRVAIGAFRLAIKKEFTW